MRQIFPRFALVMALAFCVGRAGAAVLLDASSNAVPPLGTVSVDLRFADASESATVVVLEFAFDPSLCAPIGAVLVPEQASKSVDWNVVDTKLVVVAYSLGDAFVPGDTLRLYVRVAGAAPAGAFFVARGNASATNESLDDLPVVLSGFSVNVQPVGGFHAADTDENWAISLSELLRVIQFFNANGFHCQADTEDGFAVGPGDLSCDPHDSDYVPQDWDISLGELLRLIQIYNIALGSYHPDVAGEDGFSPEPF